jgi:hypothetical protein
MSTKFFATSRRRVIAGATGVLVAGAVALAATTAFAGTSSANVTYKFAGLMGIASSQAATLNVVNVASSSCTAKLQFVDSNRTVVATSQVTIASGHAASLVYTPTLAPPNRTEVRPVVVSVGGSCKSLAPTVEVYSTVTGSTVVEEFGNQSRIG